MKSLKEKFNEKPERFVQGAAIATLLAIGVHTNYCTQRPDTLPEPRTAVIVEPELAEVTYNYPVLDTNNISLFKKPEKKVDLTYRPILKVRTPYNKKGK